MAAINGFANHWRQRSASELELTPKQKGRHEAGLFFEQLILQETCVSSISVLRDHRAAEGVVHADGAHIDILADAIDAARPSNR
jgi:hypothetical protein